MLLKYAQVEAALASMHFVPDDKAKAFRARIRNYQKIGLVPSSPGKGQKISYTTKDASIWAMCFELEEVGFSPETCKKIIENLFDIIIPFFEGGRPNDDDSMYLVLIGLFLEWHLAGNIANGLATVSGIYSMKQIEKRRILEVCQRVVLINVTGVRRKLIQALAEQTTKDR